MNADTTTSAAASATMSSTAAPKADPEQLAPLDERAFLDSEAKRAARAMAATWKDAKANLLHAVDPRTLAGHHPWIAVSSAFAAGFAAAYATIPSKDEKAFKQIALLQKALQGDDPAEFKQRAPGEDTGLGANQTSRKSRIFALITGELLKTIRPAVVSVIAAALAAKSSSDKDKPVNGRPPPAEPGDAADQDEQIPSPS